MRIVNRYENAKCFGEGESMKNFLLKIMLCLCMVTAVICGCSNDTRETRAGATVVTENDQTGKETVRDSVDEVMRNL